MVMNLPTGKGTNNTIKWNNIGTPTTIQDIGTAWSDFCCNTFIMRISDMEEFDR